MEMEREWPWGLAVLGDPTDREPVPSSLDQAGIARSTATVVAQIMHGIDGRATASASVGEEPPGLILVHEGQMHLAAGQVRLGDAAAEQVEDARVEPGLYDLRVLVDRREHPSRVHFALSLR